MENNPKELESLLAKVILKDRIAFEKLYKKTNMKLYGLLMRILKRGDLADECLQDTFVLIWQKADKYHQEKSQVMTWMANIARYRALDLLRHRKHELYLDSGVIDTMITQDNLELDNNHNLDNKKLKLCLDRLNGNQRHSLYMVYFWGYTQNQIAKHLESPIGSVKTWLHRGMITLKKCME
ncbi:MAG: RNA polymerase subunit sigma-70 [Gammaproteobacteria bacterium]|nr:MAG: RNA polymerase subunit sigma-70 [Gammaproteobacteria bacterium]